MLNRLFFLVVAVLAFSLCGCKSQPDLNEQIASTNREFESQLNAVHEKHEAVLQERSRLYKKYGMKTGDLWFKCTSTPPEKSSNQADCKKVFDRIKRDDDAEAAKEARKKAKW